MSEYTHRDKLSEHIHRGRVVGGTVIGRGPVAMGRVVSGRVVRGQFEVVSLLRGEWKVLTLGP